MSTPVQSFSSKASGGGHLWISRAFCLISIAAVIATRTVAALRDAVDESASEQCNTWRASQKEGPGKPKTPQAKAKGHELCRLLSGWGFYKNLGTSKEVYFSCRHVGEGGAMKVEAHLIGNSGQAGLQMSYISSKRSDQYIEKSDTFEIDLHYADADWASTTMTLKGTMQKLNGTMQKLGSSQVLAGAVTLVMEKNNEDLEFVSGTSKHKTYPTHQFDEKPSEDKENCPQVQGSLLMLNGEQHPCIDEFKTIIGNTCTILKHYNLYNNLNTFGAQCTELKDQTKITFFTDGLKNSYDTQGFLYQYLHFSNKDLFFDVRALGTVFTYYCVKIKLPSTIADSSLTETIDTIDKIDKMEEWDAEAEEDESVEGLENLTKWKNELVSTTLQEQANNMTAVFETWSRDPSKNGEELSSSTVYKDAREIQNSGKKETNGGA